MLLFVACAFGQTFRGDIAGTVTDSSGAALANAVVKLENPETGFVRSVPSGANGDFLFASLAPGFYKITANVPGFETKEISRIEVNVAKTTDIQIQLGVARQQAVVEVSATAVIAGDNIHALVGVVDSKAVNEMPMNGRDFRQMLKLAPV